MAENSPNDKSGQPNEVPQQGQVYEHIKAMLAQLRSLPRDRRQSGASRLAWA